MTVGLGPLAVRIVTEKVDRHISRWCSGLHFRNIGSGGDADMQVHVDLPLSALSDLSGGDRVFVYDASGHTLFEGTADNPGATSDPYAGESFDLNATGMMTLASDRTRAVYYALTDLAVWGPDAASIPSSTCGVSTFPAAAGAWAGDPCVTVQVNPGQPVDSTHSVAAFRTIGLDNLEQSIAGVGSSQVGGTTDTAWKWELWSYPINPGDSPIISGSLSTAGSSWLSSLSWPRSGLSFRLRHLGAATNITLNDYWASLGEMTIYAKITDQLGRDPGAVPGLGGGNPLTTANVVADAVYRFLVINGAVDPAQVKISGTSAFNITSLAYLQGTTAQGIFDDCANYEPDHFWQVTPSIPGAGSDPRSAPVGFRYDDWGNTPNGAGAPGVPRYEFSTRDGLSQPGSAFGLCNRVSVTWTDNLGQPRTTIVRSSVPALGNRQKDAAPIVLPAGRGNLAQGVRVAQNTLAAAAQPPQAGTLTVARPVYDRAYGKWVMPWELRAGNLALIRDTGDLLRVSEVSYDHDNLVASVVLGTPQPTQAAFIAAATDGKPIPRPLAAGADGTVPAFVPAPFRWDDGYWDTGEEWDS